MDSQFKFKPDKIKYLSNVDTLDSTHKKIIDSINKKREDIPKKTQRLEKLQSDLERLEQEGTLNPDFLFIRASLLEEIRTINEEIGQIGDWEEETEYYAKTYEILFNYYDILDGQIDNELNLDVKVSDENFNCGANSNINTNTTILNKENNFNINKSNQNITDEQYDVQDNKQDLEQDLKNYLLDKQGEQCKQDEKDKIDSSIITKNNGDEWNFDGIQIFNSVKSSKLDKLNELSKLKRKEKKVTRKRVKNVESLIQDKNYNIFDFIHSGTVKNDEFGNKSKKEKSNGYDVYDRAILYEDYRTTLEGYSFKKKNSKTCANCNIDKVLIYSEGLYVCTGCAEVENYIVESEITNYKDPMVEKPTFPYKRKNHFCEWTQLLKLLVKVICKTNSYLLY
jgi:hypothetical protein